MSESKSIHSMLLKEILYAIEKWREQTKKDIQDAKISLYKGILRIEAKEETVEVSKRVRQKTLC